MKITIVARYVLLTTALVLELFSGSRVVGQPQGSGATPPQDQVFVQSLMAWNSATGNGIVAALPDSPATGATSTRPLDTDDALRAFAKDRHYRVENSGGITVLRPERYPDATEQDVVFQQQLAGLAEAMRRLPAPVPARLLSGEWVNVNQLPLQTRSLIYPSLEPFLPVKNGWSDFLARHQVAFTFYFDPYIEIRPVSEEDSLAPSPVYRLFLRQSMADIYPGDRFVPGGHPSTLRFVIGKKRDTSGAIRFESPAE